MNIRDFKLGDKVRLTQSWLDTYEKEDMRERMATRIGKVVRNPRHPNAKSVKVLWDGFRSVSEYAPDFLKVIGDGSE